jgi:hypothetical protein
MPEGLTFVKAQYLPQAMNAENSSEYWLMTN